LSTQEITFSIQSVDLLDGLRFHPTDLVKVSRSIVFLVDFAALYFALRRQSWRKFKIIRPEISYPSSDVSDERGYFFK
jgi:hypothetical protein